MKDMSQTTEKTSMMIEMKEEPKFDLSSRNKPHKIDQYVSILQWLPKYSRMDAVSDLIAGLTLGLTMIPQSIAYASLAGLTAQYGLYSCFVGGFVYMIFGTIKEVSIGPTSLMAFLVLEYTRDLPVDFVILFTFLAGCTELLMGLLRLGFIVDFISIPVTSGFAASTSIIIIVSQMQGLLGMKFKTNNIVDGVIKLFHNYENIRLSDTILGVSCMTILLLFRKLKDVKLAERSDGKKASANMQLLDKVFWLLSISRNAMIVLVCTCVVYHLETNGSTPFVLSGKVKSGLPPIAIPPFHTQIGNQTYTFVDMCKKLGTGIIVLPLVAVLANVAIAKSFASGAAVNATQEMLTLGACNILGSFFSSMPTCGAFTRSAVSNASGIRTPMAGFYSGMMSLLALSFLTPYFYYIPRATLSAVLISAVIFLIDWEILAVLWRGSRRDAVTAVSTFFICVLFSVEVGLLVGVALNAFYLLYLSARPAIQVDKCKTHFGDSYLLLKPDVGLFYPAIDFLCSNATEIADKCGENKIPIIIDCQKFKSCDYTAVKGFERLAKDFESRNHPLWLLNMNEKVMSKIRRLGNIHQFKFIDGESNIVQVFSDREFDEMAS